MNYYPAEFKLNKKKNENSGKSTGRNTSLVALTLISLLLISAPLALFSTQVYAAEPSLSSLLNELGFTNISLSDIETFPSGIYQATLFAEFGAYNDINTLSYYPVETNDYQTIFAGPQGGTGTIGGYVIPPIPKLFAVNTRFGLSLLSPFRFFTETWRNPDAPEQHAKIYTNLDSPNMYLICWEDTLGGTDRDYNDMVVSLEPIFPPEIVNVIRSPESPNNDQSVTITAQVTKGSDEIESVILSYQIGSSSWANVSMNLESTGYVAEIPPQPYNTIVNYKVYASDTNGYSDVSSLDSYTIMIQGSSPIAVLMYSPSIADTGEVVYFDASNSYDPDGTIVSYSWDFGDGNTETGASTTHTYEEDGEYVIVIKVTDNEGLISSKVAIQLVKNRPPTAAFSTSAPTINENESVSLDASQSYDLDGTIASYTWSFEDGTAASGITTDHKYASPGYYTITLTVTDNDGATDEKRFTVFVNDIPNQRPVASFTAIPQTVNIDKQVFFDASESYDSDGTIGEYSWDFGDGTTATGVTADHAYTEAGNYTVTLTLTDNEGATDAEKITIFVTTQSIPNQPPVASFEESSLTTSVGGAIYFDATESLDPDGKLIGYAWEFGDGNAANGMKVDHIYENAGIYTVTLVVTDNEGATADTTSSITVTKNILNVSPVAIFSKSAESVNVGGSVSFDASESYDSDGTIGEYSWDFGDGTTATGVTAEHSYDEEGTYKVTLTVTDNNGDSSSIVATMTVETETTISLAVLSGIGLGITALTAALLIVLLLRRKQKKKNKS